MKATISFLVFTILFGANVIIAQEKNSQKPICKQPFSVKFDEFEYTNLNDVKEKLDLFGLQLKNLKAKGIIIGYGGKTTKAKEGLSIASELNNYLVEKFEFPKYEIISNRRGGHRENPSIELFIKPENCSAEPQYSPTLSMDEVIYKEESDFFPKDVSRKSLNELNQLLIYKVAPPFPAAARAVNAGGKVLLFVIIDEKGNVIKANSIDGHPLLTVASEQAVRNWKYQIQTENNKPVKFGGKVIIDFDEIAKNLPELTIDY
ncbi:MAG TPA: energy transducer TonB [Pyrinomonadaceae bacterium]|nr:energy transducer TonB [Pyrinomonadaceae bacterium]